MNHFLNANPEDSLERIRLSYVHVLKVYLQLLNRSNVLGGVPESDDSPKKLRYNKNPWNHLWYWPLSFGLPFFPH